MSQKISRRLRLRSFGVGAGHELAAVIVRAAGENFPPRLRMRRWQIVAVRHLLDFFRRQTGKKFARQHAQECVAQAIDSLEMFEEQEQPFEVRRLQFSIDAVKWMRDR